MEWGLEPYDSNGMGPGAIRMAPTYGAGMAPGSAGTSWLAGHSAMEIITGILQSRGVWRQLAYGANVWRRMAPGSYGARRLAPYGAVWRQWPVWRRYGAGATLVAPGAIQHCKT